MLVREAERLARHSLTEAGRDSPGLSARLLLAHVLGIDCTELLLKADEALNASQSDAFFALVQRRSQGEPVAYLLGKREFYGLDFYVNAATLIPRPESEHLVDSVLSHENKECPLLFADLGCGSGNLGIALAHQRPLWRGLLLDISSQALAKARENCALHGLTERLGLVLGDLQNLPYSCRTLDFLVANPPYIAYEERNEVMQEVLDYEPHAALFAEDHGYAMLEAAIKEACEHLRVSGAIYLEHGAKQAAHVRQMLSAHFKDIATIRDLAGHERITYGRLKG